MARSRSPAGKPDAFSAEDLKDLEGGRMILKCTNRDRYVVLIQATVRDTRLSFKARGILAFLLSHPDNWKPNIRHLENSSEKDGRDSIAAGIKELIAHGYARRVTTRDARGRIESKELQVSETPIFGQLKPVDRPETGFPVEAPAGDRSPQTAIPIQVPTNPETAIPFEVDDLPKTALRYQAEPRTAFPEAVYPEQANPQLLSIEETKHQPTKEGTKETPQAPRAAAGPPAAQPTSAAAGGGDPKNAAKPSTTTTAAWSPAGVGEWLTSFRQATAPEVDFVLGELAKKSPQEIKNPNAYADRCLTSLRASEAQRRETEHRLALSAEPTGDHCVHGANNSACPQCRNAAEEAKERIREMVAALAGKKSA